MMFFSKLSRQSRQDPDLRPALAGFSAAGAVSVFAVVAFGLSHPVYWALFAACLVASKYVVLPPPGPSPYTPSPLIQIQATLLGWVNLSSLLLAVFYAPERLAPFARYTFVISTFHFLEFVFTALTNRRSLLPDSFLLNHSVHYWIAAVTSWCEFFFELHFFPSIHSMTISNIGLALCLIGEVFRKLAMWQAGVAFTHRLALTKKPDHRLITSGLYAYLRHPGYTGWLIWSVGTQFVLVNPVCAVAYAYVSWHFFNSRIYDEERDLVDFFGQQYVDYQRNVWVGIPFVAEYVAP